MGVGWVGGVGFDLGTVQPGPSCPSVTRYKKGDNRTIIVNTL